MGRLVREHDWSATALDAPGTWPQSLRTSVRVMLNTDHPMCIFWGETGTCIHNDAYRPSLGPERHPSSLGRPAREVCRERWHVIGPKIEQGMAGRGTTWHENEPISMPGDAVRDAMCWTCSCSPLDDVRAPHGVGGVLVVCIETTQQMQLERRLADSEQRLQFALSGGRGVGTWTWDVAADRVVADEPIARLYGVDPDTAKAGAPIAEFFAAIHPADVAQVQARINEAICTGNLFKEEYRLIGGDRAIRWVLAEGRCEISADGRPLRFPGASFDVTEGKVIEQQLHELNLDLERKVAERMLERGRTWEVSPELMGVLNGAGYFESSNPAWQTVLGWSPIEVASKVFFEFIHPDDLARTQAAWDDATQRGLPALRFENRYQHKDASYRWLSWVAVPEGGKVYCSARDVTEDKERAAALDKAEDTLRQSQKMEAVGQLTGGLAHDFNNLLAAISGSLEAVERNIAKGRMENIDRFMSMARSAVKRAAALTHRLLAFLPRQTLDPKPTNINRLITDMQELITRTVGPAVHVEVVGAGGLWQTLVDPNQLENALLNLCINARDAMPDGGRLTIETANKWFDDRTAKERDLKPGQYVSLSVTDTGTGMTADVIAKAFDPFFTTKPLGQGTGLGLSMTYGFARQSGGQARIYSEVGKGTTLCIYLPPHDKDAEHDLKEQHTTALPHTGEGQVILVIDDEATLRLLIVELLEEAGYTAIEAADGASAMRVLQSRARVDLLITDVGLPGGMNGRQVADAAHAARSNLKVLFITGYAENAIVGNGRLEKWMSVVTKPFEMDALARKVEEMLAG